MGQLEEGKFGEEKQEGNNFWYKVHAKEGKVPYRTPYSVEDAIKMYLNIDYGESFIIRATWLNAFCKATESMASTNYMILPSLPEMRCFIDSTGKSFNYVIVKIPNNESHGIDKILINPRV